MRAGADNTNSPLSHRDFIRRYVQPGGPCASNTQNSGARAAHHETRRPAQPELPALFSIRMQMHFPHDLRPGIINLPVSGRKIWPALPTAHSIKRLGPKGTSTSSGRPRKVFLLQQECQRVMHHSTAGIILGADFDGFYPALLGKSGRRHRAKPFVLGDGGQIIVPCDHQVRGLPI